MSARPLLQAAREILRLMVRTAATVERQGTGPASAGFWSWLDGRMSGAQRALECVRDAAVDDPELEARMARLILRAERVMRAFELRRQAARMLAPAVPA